MKSRNWIKRILFLAVLLSLPLFAKTQETAAASLKEPVLEKSARWTDPAAYRGEIQLTLKNIRELTENQPSIGVIPVLDVTDSMDACETEGHVNKVSFHTLDAFEDMDLAWEMIKEILPDQETYAEMGAAGTENLFLKLPEELDPQQKCRLICRWTETGNDYPQDNPRGWRVVYVTEDQSLLPNVSEDADVFCWYHCISQGDWFLPVGEMEVLENRTVWKDTEKKTGLFGCRESRMDQLIEGYSQFVDTIFENEGSGICPVAFHGGYYIGGWMDSAEEAKAFLTESRYLEAEAVMPQNASGTNHEAAVAGALDALGRIETTENVFALIFTDGSTTSGYSHTEGGPDKEFLDPHSFGQEEYDPAYKETFARWAIEDAQELKEKIPVYGVGYGYAMKFDDYSQNTVEQISSGGEYFLDTKEQNLEDILDIFRAICSDMIIKTAQVSLTDYISEYWEADTDSLPLDCRVEEIPVYNQKGQKDVVQKLTFPITKAMGEDDQETFTIPITLREPYRQVQEVVWYETNQDEPLDKEEKGCGAYALYRLEEEEKRIEAESPLLDVYPAQADFSVSKKAVKEQVKAGEKAVYEIIVQNLGNREWKEIALEDIFEKTGWRAEFGACDGVRLEEKNTKAVIETLGRGESVKLTACYPIPQDQESGVFINTVYARAVHPQNPQETAERQAEAQIEVSGLTADFEVEKTADRQQAQPGDTIHYEICIRNTGEKPLSSILTVDKFLNEGVQAAFQEQDGVRLNREKTQALIEEILPKEEVTLKASVTIPEDFQEEELINMALVSLEDQNVQKEARETVTIKQKSAKTPTAPAKKQSNFSKGSSQKAGDSPKTGDETDFLSWAAALLAAGTALTAVGAGMIKKRRKKGK